MLRSTISLACVMFLASPALAQYAMPQTSPAPAPSAHMTWLQSIDQGRQVAQQTGRLVLVHFWAPDCAPCIRLEQTVYAYAAAAQRIQARFVAVKVNAQQFPMVAKQYDVTSWPKDVILAPSGQVVAVLACPIDQAAYLAGLEAAAAAADPKSSNPYANLPGAQPPTRPIMPPATAATNTAPAGVPDRYAEFFQNRPQVATNGVTSPPAVVVQPGVQGQPMMQTQVPGAQPAPAVVFPMATTTPFANGPAAAPVPSSAPWAGPGKVAQVPSDPSAAPGPSMPQLVVPQPGLQQPTANPVMPAMPPAVAAAPPAAPLALDGCCAVTLVEKEKWVRGDRRYGAVHRGQTYLFSGPEQQKRFLANPDSYSPALSGADAVLAIESRQSVPGQRKHGLFYGNRIYLFSSEATLNQFGRDPRRYAEGVRMAEAGGQGPLR